MMVTVFLLMLVGGIGFAQLVSDPREVTLRWLRLGGIIALALTGVLVTIALMSPEVTPSGSLFAAAPAIAFTLQLLSVQLARRRLQRTAAGLGFLLAAAAAVSLLLHAAASPISRIILGLDVTLGAALLGGALMTMLLGHAYLTAGGEMTQKPFLRLVRWLIAILALKLAIGLALWLGVVPAIASNGADDWSSGAGFSGGGGGGMAEVWETVLLVARYMVGLIVPAIFLYMTDDCVRRRANQSATGILYVTLVLLVIGEGAALALQSG